jgi:hypothetical protein
LLLGFFIIAFPTTVFAGHFSAREVAPVEIERELETEISTVESQQDGLQRACSR